MLILRRNSPQNYFSRRLIGIQATGIHHRIGPHARAGILIGS
jgi:hypothetical protein